MTRQLIEFQCWKSGGGCDGWFIVNINLALDGHYVFVCPNCAHEHPRQLRSGKWVDPTTEIKARGKVKIEITRAPVGTVVERIVALKSAYSKESRIDKFNILAGYMTPGLRIPDSPVLARAAERRAIRDAGGDPDTSYGDPYEQD